MTINLTTITAATDAARIDVPTCVVAAYPSAVVVEPAARERAVAPATAMSLGHVRLGADATGFAGISAWSPPT